MDDTLAGRELRPRLEEESVNRTPAAMQPIVDDTYDAFANDAARGPLEEVVTRRRDGRVFQFTRGAVIIHVATRSMHHRARALNMLKQLGMNPLPHWSIRGTRATTMPELTGLHK